MINILIMDIAAIKTFIQKIKYDIYQIRFYILILHLKCGK